MSGKGAQADLFRRRKIPKRLGRPVNQLLQNSSVYICRPPTGFRQMIAGKSLEGSARTASYEAKRELRLMARRERAALKCPSENYPESVKTNPNTECSRDNRRRNERAAIFEPRSMGTQPLVEETSRLRQKAVGNIQLRNDIWNRQHFRWQPPTFMFSSAGWRCSVSNLRQEQQSNEVRTTLVVGNWTFTTVNSLRQTFSTFIGELQPRHRHHLFFQKCVPHSSPS